MSQKEIFWEAFNDVRINKNVAEYCELSIDQLKEKCNGFKCLLASVKARMIKKNDCREFDWRTKEKPGIFSSLSSFHEKLRTAIERIETSINAKKDKAIDEADQYRAEKSGEKLKGWWDEQLIESKKTQVRDGKPRTAEIKSGETNVEMQPDT